MGPRNFLRREREREKKYLGSNEGEELWVLIQRKREKMCGVLARREKNYIEKGWAMDSFQKFY